MTYYGRQRWGVVYRWRVWNNVSVLFVNYNHVPKINLHQPLIALNKYLNQVKTYKGLKYQ